MKTFPTKYKLVSLFLLLLLASLLVASCARSAPETPSPITPELQPSAFDVKAWFAKADNYRNVGINDYEKPIMQGFVNLIALIDEFLGGAKDQMAIGKMCFKSEADAQSQIVDAALGDMDAGQIFNALMTNMPGDAPAVECAQIFRNLADYSVTHRSAIKDAKLLLNETLFNYEIYFTQWFGVDMMNDFMQEYVDPTLARQTLADHGYSSTDVTWLPTALIAPTHTDEAMCKYAMSGDILNTVPMPTKERFAGHPEALKYLYEATWVPAEFNGGKNGLCTMYRAGGLWFIKRTANISTADTNQSVNQNELESPFPQP